MEENISQKVRDRVTRFKKGDLFTVRDFEDLNNDSLVTRTLSRLQNEGIIVRVATGIYMNPIKRNLVFCTLRLTKLPTK